MGYEASDAPLGLGSLFMAIYKEEAEFASRWHRAGPDVQMTIKLIETYFSQASKQPIRGKNDSHFGPGLQKPGPEEEDEMSEEEWDDDEERLNESILNVTSWEEMVEAGLLDDEEE